MRRGDGVNPIMLHTACGAKSHKPYGSFARFEFPCECQHQPEGVSSCTPDRGCTDAKPNRRECDGHPAGLKGWFPRSTLGGITFSLVTLKDLVPIVTTSQSTDQILSAGTAQWC
jgi:hypothetical protein